MLALLTERRSNTASPLSSQMTASPSIAGLTTQQAVGEQTDLRQNPEKFQNSMVADVLCANALIGKRSAAGGA